MNFRFKKLQHLFPVVFQFLSIYHEKEFQSLQSYEKVSAMYICLILKLWSVKTVGYLIAYKEYSLANKNSVWIFFKVLTKNHKLQPINNGFFVFFCTHGSHGFVYSPTQSCRLFSAVSGDLVFFQEHRRRRRLTLLGQGLFTQTHRDGLEQVPGITNKFRTKYSRGQNLCESHTVIDHHLLCLCGHKDKSKVSKWSFQECSEH